MMDNLTSITEAIPGWIKLLDDQTQQIAERQIELAKLNERAPVPAGPASFRSLRNRGSTESLRPNDQADNPFLTEVNNEAEKNPFDTPKVSQQTFFAASNGRSRPSSPTDLRSPYSRTAPKPRNAPPVPAKPHLGTPSTPTSTQRKFSRPSPHIPSSPLPPTKRAFSVVSDTSDDRNRRTRSMIIVWYDSAVQTAFEGLVKSISQARNELRKSKMTMRVATMRNLAAQDVGSDDGDDDDDDDDDDKGGETGSGPALRLNFVSTRQMGPSWAEIGRGGGGLRMVRQAPTTASSAPAISSPLSGDIIDVLEEALAFCQATCEHAAHRFLRDGDCSIELEGIRSRLGQARTYAEEETARMEDSKSRDLPRPGIAAGVPRAQREIGRRPRQSEPIVVMDWQDDLEADDDDDDDEGVQDMGGDKVPKSMTRMMHRTP